MPKQGFIYHGIAVVVAISLVLGATYIGYRRIPSVGAQIKATDNISVTIVSPIPDSRYPADASIPITVLAIGEKDIASLEYWVDGKLLATQTPQLKNNPKLITQTWHWMPMIEGEHAITVRAKDVDGLTGTSNVVHLAVSKAAGYILLHTTKEGDTWDNLVKSCMTSVGAIAKVNPKLDTSQPVPLGNQIRIPCTPEIPSFQPSSGGTSPSAAGPASTPSAPPDKLGLWIQQKISAPKKPPAAPSLTASLNACTAQLNIQDNSQDESGFFVYRSGTSGFDRIATLGANDKASFSYNDSVQQSGLVQYYVASFNAAGETPSNIVAVTPSNGACGPASNPKVQFSNGILTVPPDFKLAYLYVSLDHGPWQRLPEGDAFFNPEQGSVDLRQYLDPLLKLQPGVRLADLKIWGWDGASQLADLGPLSVTFDHTTLEYCNTTIACGGGNDIGAWVSDPDVIGSDQDIASQTLTFQFHANLSSADAALVQISSQPFTNDVDLDSPYLVSSYPVSAEQHTGFIYGQFPIDFHALSQPGTASQSSPTLNLNWNWLSPNPANNPFPFDQDLINSMNRIAIGSSLMQNLTAPTYYIRVIPWDLNGPVGKASNAIAVTYRPQGKSTFTPITEQPPIYDIKIIGFNPEQQIDPSLFGRVQVTAVDEATLRQYLQANWSSDSYIEGQVSQAIMNMYSSPANAVTPGSQASSGNENLTIMAAVDQAINDEVNSYEQRITSGDPICPPAYIQPDESTASDLWDAITGPITEFWDMVVNAWNYVKGMVVEAIAQGLNYLTDLCNGQECRDRLMTGLNMAITYFTGLPPDLPDSKTLIGDGLDYAVSLAVQQAGVNCDQGCINEIKSDYETIEDAFIQQTSQPACFSGNGGWYGKSAMCLPPGVSVKPIPGAAYQPPSAVLQVTRNHQIIISSARQYDYSVAVNITVMHPALGILGFNCPGNGFYEDGDGNFYEGYWNNLDASEEAQGQPYTPVSVMLPGSAPQDIPFQIPVTIKDSFNIYTDPQFTGVQTDLSSGTRYSLPPGAVPKCSTLFLTSTRAVNTVQAQLMCTDRITHETAPCPTSATTQDTQQFIKNP